MYAVCVWTPNGFAVSTVAHDRTVAERACAELVAEGRIPLGAFVAPSRDKGGERP